MLPVISHWRRNFNMFLAGQFFSGITSMIVQYSLIWYLTNTTHSATVLSFAMLLGMLPMVLLSPFVGPIIDRVNKKTLLILTDVIVALFAILLALIGWLAGSFPTWLVFVVLFIRAVAQTWQQPTIQTVVPVMVPSDSLTKINGQLSVVQSANTLIAPALGAFLFGILPLSALILLDVVGAVIGTILLLQVTLPKTAAQGEPIHVVKDAAAGYRLLRSQSGLWAIVLIETLFTLFLLPAASLYPLMTIAHFHGTVAQAGIVEVAYSAGMLSGGLLISVLGAWRDRVKPILIAYLVIGSTLLLSGFVPGNGFGFWLFVGLNTLAGLAAPFFSTVSYAMVQQSFAPEQLGRVTGVVIALISLAGPLGLIIAGPVADTIGVAAIFVIAGVGGLLCFSLNLLIPTARRYDLTLQQKQTQ